MYGLIYGKVETVEQMPEEYRQVVMKHKKDIDERIQALGLIVPPADRDRKIL